METREQTEMNNLFDLITKLRTELELCRNGNNDSQVMDAVQTLNKVDNLLLKQAHVELLDFISFISKTPQTELEFYSNEELVDGYLKANCC